MKIRSKAVYLDLVYSFRKSAMENSTKTKNRKPIFDKKKQSEEITQEKLYQTSPAFYPGSSQRHTAPAVNYHSRIIFTPKPDQLYSSDSFAKSTTTPINIRVSSPLPSNIAQQPIHPAFIQRSSSPIPHSNQPSVQFCRPMSMTKISRPISQQPIVYRASTPCSVSQNENIITTDMRRSEIRPTLVAVQRVMKPVGENTSYRQVTMLKPAKQLVSTSSKLSYKPSEKNEYERVQRKGSDFDKIQKLAQMNDILAESYDNLYDELQNLKGQVTEKQVVEENLFLKKTFCEIESIFNFYTHDTLTKISRLEKERRDKHFQKENKNQLRINYSIVR